MLAHAAVPKVSRASKTCLQRKRRQPRGDSSRGFTHPEVSFVGLTEEQARESRKKVYHCHVQNVVQANSKALAEKEADGMAKLIYDRNRKMYGARIFGLHAADLVHEISNAINNEQTLYDLKFTTKAHPTLSELWKSCTEAQNWKTACRANFRRLDNWLFAYTS